MTQKKTKINKKDKKTDWHKRFNKRVYILQKQIWVQSTIETSTLILSQINSITFIESNKFDIVYSKIWNI